MEYVHFLDSDDWLELNCVEECVWYLQENNIDILIYDGKNIFSKQDDGLMPKSFLLSAFACQEGVFSNCDFFNIVKDDFFLTTCCQFRLDLLKNIRFEEGIMIEDMIFGPIVAYRARTIGLLNQQLYCRRVRADSISSITSGDQSPLCFMRDIIDRLGCERGRLYFYYYSNVLVCFMLYQYFFVQKKCTDTKILDRINQVIRKRIPMAFYALHFESDPRGAREKLNNLKNYLQYVGWSSKLAYYCPHIFRILKEVKNIIKK